MEKDQNKMEKVKHILNQSANDWATCKCGKLFSDSKTKSALKKLEEHIVKENGWIK